MTAKIVVVPPQTEFGINAGARRELPEISVADAVRLKAHARRKRVLADVMQQDWGDRTGAIFERVEADGMDRKANAALDPSPTPPCPCNPVTAASW